MGLNLRVSVHDSPGRSYDLAVEADRRQRVETLAKALATAVGGHVRHQQASLAGQAHQVEAEVLGGTVMVAGLVGLQGNDLLTDEGGGAVAQVDQVGGKLEVDHASTLRHLHGVVLVAVPPGVVV